MLTKRKLLKRIDELEEKFKNFDKDRWSDYRCRLNRDNNFMNMFSALEEYLGIKYTEEEYYETEKEKHETDDKNTLEERHIRVRKWRKFYRKLNEKPTK